MNAIHDCLQTYLKNNKEYKYDKETAKQFELNFQSEQQSNFIQYIHDSKKKLTCRCYCTSLCCGSELC